MKVALLAAAASLVLAFAAHAADAPLAARLPVTPPSALCKAGPLQKTSFTAVADQQAGPEFCPRFLSTRVMTLSRHDART